MVTSVSRSLFMLLLTTTGIVRISPRFIECGRVSVMKNALYVVIDRECWVKPKPLIGSIEKPVMAHDVSVSGSFLRTV